VGVVQSDFLAEITDAHFRESVRDFMTNQQFLQQPPRLLP